MTKTALPKGWGVEFLGLIEGVQFRKGRQVILWCDREWRIGTDRMLVPARGIPSAKNMLEARRVGTQWLHDNALESEDE